MLISVNADGTPWLMDSIRLASGLAGAWGRSRFAVGGDHPLVDTPGGFDLDVGIAGEQASSLTFCRR